MTTLTGFSMYFFHYTLLLRSVPYNSDTALSKRNADIMFVYATQACFKSLFILYRNEKVRKQIMSVIKLWGDTDWYLILILRAEYTSRNKDLSSPSDWIFQMMSWWNTVKHNLAGEKFKELTFYWLSVCEPSNHADCWYLESWRAVNLSDSQLVLPGWLTVTGKHFSPSRAKFKLQKLLFSDFSHYNLQLSSEFRLCNIIIVSECQTGNLKTVMMR